MNSETPAAQSGSESFHSEITSALNTCGYFVARRVGYKKYNEICASLGEIVQLADVKVNEARVNYLTSCAEVPFHTDNPTIKFVSWYCFVADENDGENLLIDGRAIINKLSPEKVSYLQQMSAYLPNRRHLFPMLRFLPDIAIYYSPVNWHLHDMNFSATETAAIEEFENALKDVNPISVKLMTEDALFINNYFILHGRKKIDQNSQRHLARAYIKCDH